ncbi:MAG TPA: glycosyltransferase [bacterium]|nr:glycosyltransferase [bacterium]
MLFGLFIWLLILAVVYSAALLILFFHLFLIKLGTSRQQFQATVVVAARDEEKNIADCLTALINQNYPGGLYEIIIVDDRSRDKTAEIVASFQKAHPQIKLIQIKKLADGYAPKKYALSRGIAAANGEIIFTTDADCVPSPTWVQTMLSYFEPEVGLVAGFSPLQAKNKTTLFSKLMTLDSLSLGAVAAGSFAMGRPLTCNGRNLAYRKAAYSQVNGFLDIREHISGDDDLLLHLIISRTQWQTRYAFNKDAIVPSAAPENFHQFANQRIRHASKGFHYSAWLIITLAAIYLFNLLLVILLPVSIIAGLFFNLWLISFVVKTATEFIFLYKAAGVFGYCSVLRIFPVAAILHPIYVVIFGLCGQFGKFKWKE